MSKNRNRNQQEEIEKSVDELFEKPMSRDELAASFMHALLTRGVPAKQGVQDAIGAADLLLAALAK